MNKRIFKFTKNIDGITSKISQMVVPTCVLGQQKLITLEYLNFILITIL